MELRHIGYYLLTGFVLLAVELDFTLSARCPNLSLPNGRARMRSRGRTVQFRCHRGFTRVGAKMAICLKSKQWSQKMPLCVGQGCPALDLPETVTTSRLYRGGIVHFTCTTGHTRVGPEQIYCDGNKWNAEPPVCQRGMTLGCDFETEGLCGWSQVVSSDKLDWIWHKGATPTKGTGPTSDNTKGTPEGHYLFIETSAPSKRGHSAQLVSPIFDPNDAKGMCMDWAYHMYGSQKPRDVGKLEVFIRPTSVPLNKLHTDAGVISLFDMNGNQGDEWHTQEVGIPDDLVKPFQIVFEGMKLNSWLSDIAIDDIRLFKCDLTTTSPATTEANSTSMSTSLATRRRTTTPEILTTIRRRRTTTEMPVITKRRRTTTEMPTTTRRRRTTTDLPTTRRRRTTTEIPTTRRRRRRRTTTEMSTTRRRTTTEMPTTRRRRTTTEIPTTRRRRTTTEMPTTRRRRTTTEMPTTRRRRRTTTTEMPTTRRIRTATTEMPTTRRRTPTTEMPTTRRRRTTTAEMPTTRRRRTTTTEMPTTRRRRTTTAEMPTTRRRRTTTAEMPTTRRRRTTTTEMPTTRRRRNTTAEMPTTRRRRTTTTEMPTTRRRRTTTTEMPTTRRRTTTAEMPTTRRRRTTTAEMPTTTKRRTTTGMPTTRRRRRTTTPEWTRSTTSGWVRRRSTTPERPRRTTTYVWVRRSTTSEITTTNLAMNSQQTSSSNPLKMTSNGPISSTKMDTDQKKSAPVQDFFKTSADLTHVSTDAGHFYNNTIIGQTLHDKNGLTTTHKSAVGEVKDAADPASSGTQKLMPLILGVVGAVILVAIVIAVLAYKWSKKQRIKEEKEMEDQMNIISEYVETSLSN